VDLPPNFYLFFKFGVISIRYSTLLYASLRYSTLLYATLRYSTLLYATLRYSTLLYATLRYSTLLYATLHFAHLSFLPIAMQATLVILSLAPNFSHYYVSRRQRTLRPTHFFFVPPIAFDEKNGLFPLQLFQRVPHKSYLCSSLTYQE
jgi:hypothetical protein